MMKPVYADKMPGQIFQKGLPGLLFFQDNQQLIVHQTVACQHFLNISSFYLESASRHFLPFFQFRHFPVHINGIRSLIKNRHMMASHFLCHFFTKRIGKSGCQKFLSPEKNMGSAATNISVKPHIQQFLRETLFCPSCVDKQKMTSLMCQMQCFSCTVRHFSVFFCYKCPVYIKKQHFCIHLLFSFSCFLLSL